MSRRPPTWTRRSLWSTWPRSTATRATLVSRAGGLPIRVVSKSLRCRYLVERALAQPGYRGIMCYSLAEALCAPLGRHERRPAGRLPHRGPRRAARARRECHGAAAHHGDRRLRRAPRLHRRDARRGSPGNPGVPGTRRVVAAGRRPGLGEHRDLAVAADEPGNPRWSRRQSWRGLRFVLVGVLGYEGQIAGLGDSPPGNPVRAALVRAIQARSAAELRERRTETVRRIRALTTLEFVNGGGTGSLESTAADESVTELAAGSGLVGPTLFDAYRGSSRTPPSCSRCR